MKKGQEEHQEKGQKEVQKDGQREGQEDSQREGQEKGQKEEDRVQKDIMVKVEKTDTFIKQLNTSSVTNVFVILIAVSATNCATNLMIIEITHFQAGAVLLRFFLWMLIAIFPFFKAAAVNSASKELHDTLA